MNIKVICGKCGKEFDIYKKTYNRKIKNNESFLCKECRYKKQAEFNRNYMNSLSDEEKSKRSKQSSEGAKKQWQNMSKEEKIKRSKNNSERMSKYNNKRWSDISIEDKEKSIKRINEGRNKWYSDLSQEEKNNKIQLLNTRHNEWWNSLSEEEKEKWSKKSSDNRIKYLENLSDEERIKQHKLLSDSLKKYWSNISNEEREKYSKMASERNRKRWDNLSDEERLYYIKILHDSNIEYWNTLPNDDRQNISNKMKSYWNNLSDNEKNEKLLLLQNGNKEWRNNLTEDDLKIISEQQSKNGKKRWNKMTNDDRNKFSNQISSSMKEFWEKISTEQRDAIKSSMSLSKQKWWNELDDDNKKTKIKEMNDGYNRWWNSLSTLDKINISTKQHETWKIIPIKTKEDIIHRRIVSSSSNNKLHQSFERQFVEYCLPNSFYLIPEYPTSNNDIIHCWDYAIFRDDKLECVVDLDGTYFHADNCDYDGMHSKIEYDEKRGLSIPDGVKWCIIYEKDFDKSFEYMRNILSLSYDEFINKRFNEYRSMPFPYPEYTSNELLKSYHDLCKLNCNDKYHRSLNVNTRIGDRIIQHFHRSMYDNIIDVWNNDDTLRSMITQGYLYHSYLNKNKILQGFNIYEPAQRVSILSAGKAKMIINKYLNKCDEVFDPFSGYGGIMLACIAMNKRYVGLCSDEVHACESLNMIQFLKDNGVDMDASFNDNRSGYQCLFTELNDDDQIDKYLTEYKCKRYVFVVDETNKYKNNIVDVINNKSHREINYDKMIVLIEGQ